MENIDSISDSKIMAYLIKNSKELIRESNLSQQEKSKYLDHSTNEVINKAADLYFKAKGFDQINKTNEKITNNTKNSTSLNSSAFQPTFTVVNMTPCQVDYTVFIHTQIGGCVNNTGGAYYTSDDLLHVPAQTTLTFSDGFASFGNHTWYPNNETTQQLVDQGLTAYYDGAKFLVGTNCSNVSIGYCGASSNSSSQSCSGCGGGANFYTASFYNTSGIINPDSSELSEQDITLFILQ